MMDSCVTVGNILKLKRIKIDEQLIWSFLSLIIENIQNSNFIEQPDVFLITTDNVYVSPLGKLVFTIKNQYKPFYYTPNILHLHQTWVQLHYDIKLKVILYSLGKMLELLMQHKNESQSPKSNDLSAIINELIDSNDGSITISKIQSICGKIAKSFSFKDKLISVYHECANKNNAIKSSSTSNLNINTPDRTYERNNSIRVLEKQKSLNADSASLSSTMSGNTGNSNSLCNSRNGNIYLGRLDNYVKPNIPAALERLKAQRKVSKTNGPIKSPAVPVEGIRNDLEQISLRNSISSQNISFTEMSNIERLNGDRKILGPEFIIRKTETFNVSCHLQRRNSLFSRTDSTRNLNFNVEVNLLNGVSLSVRNLNKQSILKHVINAVHGGYPDLEFVHYGLCFMLDEEFFFVKEDRNIQKLADYLFRKSNSSKVTNGIENNKNLHLYYRIKFYPTEELIFEMNSFNRKLFYLQLRQDLLYLNNPPINLSESLTLAGIAIQAEYGFNINNLIENSKYLRIEYYFHKYFRQFLKINDNEIEFLKLQQNPCINMDWETCETLFIEKIYQNKFYGMHWYRVNKNQYGIIDAIGKNTYLVIGRDSIQLLDSSRSDSEIQIHKHFSYKWSKIDSISIKQRKILIKPKMQLKIEGLNKTTNSFVCYVDSKTKAENIIRLCNEHHLLASQNDETESNYNNNSSVFGSHRRLSIIDYPSSLTRTSLTFNDDENDNGDDNNSENLDDNPVSDDEICQNSKCFDERSNLSKQKRFSAHSMINISDRKIRQTNNTNGNRFSNLDHEDNRANLGRTPIKSQSKKIQNEKSNNEFFQVDIIRENVSNENLGIGIIKIQTQTYEGMFIKRIVKDSSIDKCGQLKIGDEIVYINDQCVSDLTQSEVGNVIKNCGESIRFLIRKHPSFNVDCKQKTIKKALSFSQATHNSMITPNEMENKKQRFNIFTKQSLSQILHSNKPFIFFEKLMLERIFPNLKLFNEQIRSTISFSSFDEIVNQELNSLQNKKLLISNSACNKENNEFEEIVNIPNGNNVEKYANAINRNNYKIKIEIDKICAKEKLEVKDLGFTLVPIKQKIDQSFWNCCIEMKYKLIILFIDCHQNGFNLTQQIINTLNIKIQNGKFSVIAEEIHEFSETIKFLRLSVRIDNDEFDNITNHRLFVIGFINISEDLNKYKSNESILQAINIACGIHETFLDSEPIIIYSDQIHQKIGMFITIYSFISCALHRKLPINLLIQSQTTIFAIYTQIINQNCEFIPNENQYRICISILKQLTASTNRANSLSDISDIN